MRIFAALAFLLFVSAVERSAAKPAPDPVLFDAWNGPALRLFVHRPKAAPDDAPVVFVMHGVKRDADRYFDDWLPLADRYGFVVVVPEFSVANFPGADGYNLGGVINDRGAAAPRETWAYSSIEPMFDAVRSRLGLTTQNYLLYGHSAGAQFAHRFALFGAGRRARLVIAANAGWYTFPESGAWPYGPQGLPDGLLKLAPALSAPLAILAGEADIDPGHPSLRHSPEAEAQGPHRLARAKAFYAAGQASAAKSGFALNWSCTTAPGVEHDDAQAAPFAVKLLLGPAPQGGGPCQRGEPAK